MNENKFEIFYNDTFKVLNVIKESEININNETVSPLLYEDIGNKLGMTRQTISRHIQNLEENGFVEIIKRGRLRITKKGNQAIKKIK